MTAGTPESVTAHQLREISARVGDRTGWDFSPMHVVRDEGRWRYEDVVADVAAEHDRVLDIGTAGGEVLSRLLADVRWSQMIAIDHQKSMATVARRRLSSAAAVIVADAVSLPVPDGSIDMVLNRHAQVWPAEVARVLRAGGRFVLQQVGAKNAQTIFDAFGWGSNWDQFRNDSPPPRACRDLAIDFEDLGMKVERLDEHEGGYAFVDLDSLVFFLKSAPFPERFDPESHISGINRLLAGSRSDRGIETTEHRELIVTSKSES